MQVESTTDLPLPDDILAGWRSLVATGAHVHLPQIAEHLNVPQAALLAARVGVGATRLHPDLAEVLRPIKDWHRVLFVASSELGVFMPMDKVTEAMEEAGVLTLSGETFRARITPSPVREIYIFEDSETGPGTSKSIQAFDEAGEPLLKVVLFHKPSFRAAQDWTAKFVHPDQSRTWQPVATACVVDRRPKATPSEQRGDVPAFPFAETLESARASGRHLTIKARATGLELDWHGQLTKLKQDGAMVHLHEHTLRAHLNLTKAQAVSGGDVATQLHVTGQAGPALEIVKGEV